VKQKKKIRNFPCKAIFVDFFASLLLFASYSNCWLKVQIGAFRKTTTVDSGETCLLGEHGPQKTNQKPTISHCDHIFNG
jgi:hypothetical protein